MSAIQKRTAVLLAAIGLLYFLVFCFPNARGARSVEMLNVFSNDETITYPYVVHMLTPARDIHDFVWRLFIYGDYHYGYPFYFFSFLAVLPVRLLAGADFTSYVQLNLLLLRQLISVLPMILAAGVVVYMQTRFQSPLRAAGLFALILAVPGIVRNHLWWWHPDALSVLAVALTLFFLDRDRLRLGRNFLLAAAACGMAIAIKLVGFFFVFLLAGYVLAAWLTHRATFKQAALRSLGFVLVMGLVVLLANPFLFYATQREKMLRIQAQKSQELSVGYSHDEPAYYQKGPRWWQPTVEKWYGPTPFLLLLLGLVITGCFWGESQPANRLILAWIVPYSIYLLYFVAVKPDHYWLPVMLPLFSGALNAIPRRRSGTCLVGLSLAIIAVLLWQAAHFAQVDIGQYLAGLGMEAARGD
jgi:4-amino-4-deoxy-L-arabinose transferase-like glycosyltransferase